MRDARVGTSGTTFSQLYTEIKDARRVDRLEGSKVLYLKDGNAESAFFSATKFWAGRAGRKASGFIYGTIQTEYGDKVAKRVFRQVMGQAPPGYRDEFRKISLDKLRALKNVLSYERKLPQYRDKGTKPATFTKMREDVGSLKKKRERQGKGDFELGKHLRFTAEKNLYVHTKWSTGFKNRLGLQTSRQDKRTAAGSAIWKAIAEEHGEGTADEVFRRVFGNDAFRAIGADHKIAVTMKQFKDIEDEIDQVGPTERALNDTKRFLDTIKHTKKASPLDALTALFGPLDDTGTEAALKRLAEVAPPEVMRTLRERPKALLDYVKDKNWLVSLLERAARKVADDDAKSDIVDMHGDHDSEPEIQAADETWAAVFGRLPSGRVNFPDAEPVDQTLTDQNIRALLVTARLQALSPPLRKEGGPTVRLYLWSEEEGITRFRRLRDDNNKPYSKHEMYPNLSLGDVRAFDDLLVIGRIMRAVDKGEIDLDEESKDMLARRTAEIRTQFKRLLENDLKMKREFNKFRQRLRVKTEDKLKSAPKDKGDPYHLLRSWRAKNAEYVDLSRKINAIETASKADARDQLDMSDEAKKARRVVMRLRQEMDGKNSDEIRKILVRKREAVAGSLALDQKAYRQHDWTKRMVKSYEHLGFRDDVNYLEPEEFKKVVASLRARWLLSETDETLTKAVTQAEKLERQILDA